MKHFFFIVLLTLSNFFASAQNEMYLYFESENLSPFYLKIDDKVYTSVAPGYYVLPGLTAGRYNITIGIPSSSRLENRFEIDLKDRDRGLLIKSQGQTLILQDMNDGSAVHSIKDGTLPEITYEPRTDPFTILLSKASGDPGLLMSPVFAKAETRQDVPTVSVKQQEELPIKSEALTKPESIPIKTDTIAVEVYNEETKEVKNSELPEKEKLNNQKELIKDTSIAEAVSQTSPNKEDKQINKVVQPGQEDIYSRTSVRKFAEGSTSEGFSLVYIDDRGISLDTIRLMIPNPKYNLVNAEVKEKQDQKFLELKEEKENKTTKLIEDSVKGKPEVSPVMPKEKDPREKVLPLLDSANGTATGIKPKNSCKSVATDNDFFKLRKNMAAQVTDEEMVAEAKKSFKSRCFETEQIKNLSSLFLTSAGKYLFFDAAYLHVSDPENFVSLQNEIKDEYYKKRFNALIGL